MVSGLSLSLFNFILLFDFQVFTVEMHACCVWIESGGTMIVNFVSSVNIP